MQNLRLGIDIGSTTIKAVVLDATSTIQYSSYIRHNTLIKISLQEILYEINRIFGDQPFQIAFTGSAGMGIAERTQTLFIQEIIAAAQLVKMEYPEVRSLIDIGGEDAKLVLLEDPTHPDIRMNGNCAGGTGAYIDQMAALLNITIEELNRLALESDTIYPIASRCGVFAKTDVQNLTSRKIKPSNIAASIFEAVANQTINALAKGSQIKSKILVCGGPLSYISQLRKAFAKVLHLEDSDLIVPENGALFTVIGTAISIPKECKTVSIHSILKSLKEIEPTSDQKNNLLPLFNNKIDFTDWHSHKNEISIIKGDLETSNKLFIGIDSGSTTTKIAILNEKKELIFQFYKNHNGDPLQTVTEGLLLFHQHNPKIQIPVSSTCVTGYGEELIQKGFSLDYSIVETVAHTIAAQDIDPEVSFILDIGGQDMKAIFIQNGTISNMEINEACSSGCGTFIEGFAHTLGYSISEFAEIALDSQKPYDLGSRCTVFMNSKVKQALRDGATIADLSAGLAYSVVKNCLNKVLRLSTFESLGEHLVVQGGTFRNKAVFRSLELLTGKKVSISNFPEIMGAYGAALYAIQHEKTSQISSFIGWNQLLNSLKFDTEYSVCKGCTNHCNITIYKFPNQIRCFAGHKCEKIFSNSGQIVEKGVSIFEIKKERFQKREVSNTASQKIGIPMILNMFENYPFWNTLFKESGLEVVRSDDSSQALYQKGIGGAMSDNICLPAKLSHGHIINLIEKKVDRIFLPIVVYEKKQFNKTTNSFNCPVVTGYPEVLESGIIDLVDLNIVIDKIPVNFKDPELLRKSCQKYLKSLDVSAKTFKHAFKKALEYQQWSKNDIIEQNERILKKAIELNRPIILVAGHPYHADPFIHQNVSSLLADLGVFVINEEIAAHSEEGFDHFFTISQWEYTNRILHAVKWVGEQSYPIGIVQLNSFGCGLDSIILGEVKELVNAKKIPYAWVRIDEISSPGSIKLRLRSLVESMKMRNELISPQKITFHKPQLPVFDMEDRKRTILFPWFSDFYSPLAPILAKQIGYNFENLPPSDQESIDLGLKFANNEVCYPATLVVGDIIKGLKSGRYQNENIAIGITQTGGQCRATNYLSLIKRGITNAGFHDVPIIGLGSPDAVFNLQPGFKPHWLKIIKAAFMALLYADSISQLYYATASREKSNTQSKILKDKYINLAKSALERKEHHKLPDLLQEAVFEFNQITIHYEDVQTVGIVGEIYVKYNAYGQYNMVEWLIENHVEVVIPPLLDFMMQAFVNNKVQRASFIAKANRLGFTEQIAEKFANRTIKKFDTVLKRFKYYRPNPSIHHAARLASEILNLNHQYGEGWLIPAEAATFAEQNINNVICLQPFGCIANHIIGKGMEKKIKLKYPQLNLLYLDFDSGISKVNVINRIHFLLQNCRKE
ncbi:MAG: Activator of (R)-2-hydroxyglutaryl-CoA dehydratase [Bacteroidetes bacterium]|nr:Activator of (R)-2-hydroxyglutaryl-CoA dehydratase [Bacteroidota bacterium]